jgi:hypothetical protein
MVRYLPCIAAVVAVLLTGVVHGVWTDRWSTLEAATTARLECLPMTLGDWKGQDVEIDRRFLGPVTGCIHRRYVNQRNGVAVSLTLVSGRPGPVAIHTPDVCYVASGFRPASAEKFVPRLDPSLPAAEFMTAQFVKSKSAEQTNLRVFWSWNADGRWVVADTPRFAFAPYRVLYKLHLVRELAVAGEPLDDDPCVQLMQQLLPELQKTVFSPA